MANAAVRVAGGEASANQRCWDREALRGSKLIRRRVSVGAEAPARRAGRQGIGVGVHPAAIPARRIAHPAELGDHTNFILRHLPERLRPGAGPITLCGIGCQLGKTGRRAESAAVTVHHKRSLGKERSLAFSATQRWQGTRL